MSEETVKAEESKEDEALLEEAKKLVEAKKDSEERIKRATKRVAEVLKEEGLTMELTQPQIFFRPVKTSESK